MIAAEYWLLGLIAVIAFAGAYIATVIVNGILGDRDAWGERDRGEPEHGDLRWNPEMGCTEVFKGRTRGWERLNISKQIPSAKDITE